jgi:PTS system nitrogen regulatory IIA component
MPSGNTIITDNISPENILIRPTPEDRKSVVKTLIENLVETGKLAKSQVSSVSRLIKEREDMGSTAIGGGVALPHARVKFTDRIICAYALLEEGEGFNSLDGAPVSHVFLILSPKDDDQTHIAFLKALTLFTRNHVALHALAGCKTAKEACSVMQDYA